MYEIRNVPIGLIDPNPHRDLGTYPWIEGKIGQLIRSIDEVGFWAGVIARPAGRRYEMAFGHHRIEAARRRKMKEVPLILDAMTDHQMLQYMGRENGEDYSSDFLVMLNTWDGGVKFAARAARSTKDIDIASILGWLAFRPNGERHMSDVALACAAGHRLIAGGHMARNDLRELTVREAREIVSRAQDRIEQLDKIGKREGHKAADTRRAQAVVGKAARITARQARDGDVTTRSLRSQVDINTMEAANTSKVKTTPLFAIFGQNLCDSIGRMLNNDASAERINQIVAAIPNLELEEDHAILRKLQHELGELSHRADRAKVRVTPNKVVKLKSVEQRGA